MAWTALRQISIMTLICIHMHIILWLQARTAVSCLSFQGRYVFEAYEQIIKRVKVCISLDHRHPIHVGALKKKVQDRVQNSTLSRFLLSNPLKIVQGQSDLQKALNHFLSQDGLFKRFYSNLFMMLNLSRGICAILDLKFLYKFFHIPKLLYDI